MKKTILALFIAIGIIFTFQVHLSQARIIIDTLEDIGPDGTHVTSLEIAGVTVTISTADQTPMKAYTYYESPHAFAGKDQVGNAPLHPENVSGNRFISAQYINLRQPIVFTFSKPVIGFGFTTLDLLENGCHSTDFIKLEALNSNGQVVDSQTLTGPQGLSGLDIHWYLSSNIPEITQVVLSSNIVYGPHYGIDDLLIDVEPITHNIIDATYGAGVGSFEKGTIVLGGQPFSGTSWMGVAPGDNKTIKGWTVGGPGNGVDWILAPYFRADSGKRSIDLQHTSSSSISTIIPTITGRLYELSFGAASVSGSNYNNNGIVSAGSLLNQPFYAEFSSDFSSQTYKPHTFYFTATEETTTVHFEAVGPGVYGPVIDSVSVKEVIAHDDPEKHLVAWWPLDGNAVDISGNENHGQIFGATPCEDRFGNPQGAMCFNGALAQYINIGNKVKPPFPFTISGWVKPGTNQGMWVLRNDQFFSDGVYGAVNSVNDTHMGGAYGDGGPYTQYNHTRARTEQGVVEVGNWQQITVVYNAHQDIRLYGNCTEYPPIYIGTSSTMQYSNADGAIGLGDDIGRFNFTGAIDDLRVYNRALLPEEIAQLCQEIPDHFGTTLQTAPNHDFFVEQNVQTTESISLYNPGNEERTATLEILNPHPELDVSLQNEEIIVGPRATETVSIIINAAYTLSGIYEDLLLKISVDDGETLFSNIKVTIVAPDETPLPDLSIRSDDIRLADDTVTLSATIENKGLEAASGVEVEFFDLFGNSLGDTTLDEIPSQGSKTASITTTFTAGEHLVRVVVDPEDQITEIDKNNNEASTVIRVGTGEPLSGNILITGSLPSNVYTGSLFTISGRAVYDIYQDGVRYTNYAVKGGSVQITIRNSEGAEWVYGGIYTNVDGNFRKSLHAPSEIGDYKIFMKVTDNTFVGNRELSFSTTERDPTPPPAPNLTGSGEWVYKEGTWTWTWIVRPVNEPSPQSDVRVYSENIHFTKTNPEPHEEITVFAEILYWATSSDLTANNVPVNFYVTYPGEDKINIGSTLISSISVGAPDFGSRYVYTTWKNHKGGIYIVEVEIDPSYKEENMLNNAATRAIIVGQLSVGAISGQVTDAWGGISDVTIELYSNGDFISDTLTDDTGLYFFPDLQPDEYQVHISTPDGYEADAEMKTASVSNQVTEVNFHLTGQSHLFADAGENVAINSEEQCGTIIEGYGENAVEYRWLQEETVLLDWIPIGVNNEAYLDLCDHFLNIGQHTLTLEVRDGNWLARDEMFLTIDNSPPDVSPSGAGTYHINDTITVGGYVSDFDGDLLSYSWSKGEEIYFQGTVQSEEGGEPVQLPFYDLPDLGEGDHPITIEVSDDVNIPVSATVHIKVISTPDPTLSPIASPGILWPPNHKMVDVIIYANAQGACDITLSAYISSNEPIDGTGDGHFSPDWELLEIDQVNQVIYLQLRAERSGRGKGRVYTVTVTATDCYGNSSSSDVKVVVPHDQRAR